MRLYYLLLIFCFLLGLNSCNETENTIEDLWIEASPETVARIPEEGGTFTITTRSNISNKLTTKYSNWITLENTEVTSEGNKYTFKVDRNVNTEKRNGEVKFTARGAVKKIEVTQAAAPDLLNFTLDKEIITLNNQDETETSITVFCDAIDVEFNITKPSWVSQMSKTELIGDDPGWIYKFKIEKNNEPALRNGVISFENPNNPGTIKTVTIVQPSEPSDGELDINFKPAEEVYKLDIKKAYASYGSNKYPTDPENEETQRVYDGNTTNNFSGPYSKEAVKAVNNDLYLQYQSEYDKWPIPAEYLSKAFPLANGGNYLILTLQENSKSIDYMKFYPRNNANGLWGKIDIWVSTTEDQDDFVKVLNQFDCKYLKIGFAWIPLDKKKQLRNAKRVKIAIYDAVGAYIAVNEIEFYSVEK